MTSSHHLVVPSVKVAQTFVEVSMSLVPNIVGSFLVRINNTTCTCNLCMMDDYDYENPKNNPVFEAHLSFDASSYFRHNVMPMIFNVDLSTKDNVVWSRGFWYLEPHGIWRDFRKGDRRRLIRKCKKVLRKDRKWHWVVGVDYGK